ELAVEHRVEPRRFVLVALDRVRDLLRRVVNEMVCLAQERPETAHLPEQPFVDLDLLAPVRGVEPPELGAEILEDRARFKDRNGRAAGSLRIDDGRNLVV